MKIINNMKKPGIIIFLLLVAGLSNLLSQDVNTEFEYSYDLSGNRISRRIIELRDTRNIVADSIYNDTQENPVEISLDDINISLFPNPVTESLNLQLGEYVTGISYQVIDINGRVITDNNLKSQSININFSGMEAGNYILRICKENKSKEFKIIKY